MFLTRAQGRKQTCGSGEQISSSAQKGVSITHHFYFMEIVTMWGQSDLTLVTLLAQMDHHPPYVLLILEPRICGVRAPGKARWARRSFSPCSCPPSSHCLLPRAKRVLDPPCHVFVMQRSPLRHPGYLVSLMFLSAHRSCWWWIPPSLMVSVCNH